VRPIKPCLLPKREVHCTAKRRYQLFGELASVDGKRKKKRKPAPLEMSAPRTIQTTGDPTQRSPFQRALAVVEQPLILTAIFTIGGIVGAVIYTPIVILCAVSILLGIHRSRMLVGSPFRLQMIVYVVVTVMLAVGGYFLYNRLDAGLDGIQTKVARKIASLLQKQTPAPADNLSFDSYASNIDYPEGHKVGEITWKKGYVDVRVSIETPEPLITDLNLTVKTLGKDVNLWGHGADGKWCPRGRIRTPSVA
jgi:hypothetical protein